MLATLATLVGALVLLPGAASAQKKRAGGEVLKNPGVIEMVRAEIPEEIIIAKIQASRTDFDLSTAGLVKLNQNKVPSPVIKAMLGSTNAAPAATASAPRATARRADGGAAVKPPREPGLHLYADFGEGKRFAQLEPTVYSQAKTGGAWKTALTYGVAKTKMKAVIRNRQAAIRTSDPLPTFFFVFEQTNAGMGNSSTPFTATTSPNEFTLIRFQVKRDTREVVMASHNAYSQQSGTEDEANVPFTFTKLRPGVYRVTPSSPLTPGEYCFLSASGWGGVAAGTAGANRVFDFSITPAQ